jgi:hypothetical protein
MSDELKPEPQAPEAENSELSGKDKDMEEVVAGAAIVSDPDEGGDVQVVSELTKDGTKGNVAAKWNIAKGSAA